MAGVKSCPRQVPVCKVALEVPSTPPPEYWRCGPSAILPRASLRRKEKASIAGEPQIDRK